MELTVIDIKQFTYCFTEVFGHKPSGLPLTQDAFYELILIMYMRKIGKTPTAVRDPEFGYDCLLQDAFHWYAQYSKKKEIKTIGDSF